MGDSMSKELNEIIMEDRYRCYGKKTIPMYKRIWKPRQTKVLICFRKAQYYYLKNKKILKLIYKIRLKILSERTSIQILPNTSIGKGFYIGHMGRIIINSDSVLGDNINIATGVTIGQMNRGRLKGSPKIGNEVWIGTNAVIVGKITIGNDVMIAPNAYVNMDVPDHSIVIGNPGIIHFKAFATQDYIENKIQ